MDLFWQNSVDAHNQYHLQHQKVQITKINVIVLVVHYNNSKSIGIVGNSVQHTHHAFTKTRFPWRSEMTLFADDGTLPQRTIASSWPFALHLRYFFWG